VFLLSILLGLKANQPLAILGSMGAPRSRIGLRVDKGNANAVDVPSGESSASIAASISFAVRVVQFSKDPDAVGSDEGPFDGREGQTHPREADIEGFHFL
jgi:hypothetical protein